jgi:tetratricopeptide (TPR) repeat protein
LANNERANCFGMKAIWVGTLTFLFLMGAPWVQAQDASPVQPPPDAPVETRADVVVTGDQLNAAIAQTAQELQDNPHDAAIYVKLGRLFIQKNDNDSAIATLGQAIKIDPWNYQAFFNRGRSYKRKGDFQDAIADYDQAIHLNSRAFGSYTNRGQIYAMQGNLDQAIADETQSITITPTHSLPFNVRANCFAKKGEYEKAAADYASALQLSPNFNSALNNYAWLLATCPQDSVRDGKTAVEDATHACEQTHWMWPATIDTLAAAYAETGDFDSAIKWENKFLEYAISDATAEKARERLALYQSHQPYRREDGASSNEDGGQ